ncbi:unnamed protein product [Caenorhabditis auriculariae]|uniref:ShKT domain-containing protein n=1 Tax=Caenorhabditis auriculariae TaxID=2777116 RepID=A0A8S1HR03_9PELO|nr:unnamed protein product [Caenorhabditis auriculariae]
MIRNILNRCTNCEISALKTPYNGRPSLGTSLFGPSRRRASEMLFLVALLFSVQTSEAVIRGDLNCTSYNGTAFVYSNAATICQNTLSENSCNALYPTAPAGGPLPAPGNDIARPTNCYTTTTATPAPINNDMKNTAIKNCPRTCGYCCQTPSYSCANAQYPSMNCATITNSQCLDPNWRSIIAANCPAACGLCNTGGCVDAVVDCANDISICNSVGLQSFVNTYCQRTCGRCASTTKASSLSSSTCTSYIANSSPNCVSWAANGFCSNSFYTLAQRKAYCATSCRIC